MLKFKVQVGKDARVYYSTEIEAESLEAVKAMVSRHGMTVPEGTIWKQDGIDDFDNVETVSIHQDDCKFLASYDDNDGWENAP